MRLLSALSFFALVMFSALAPASAQGAGAASVLEPLQITTASGKHDFSVEVMRTDEERAKGLMYRRFMAPNRGMLFDFKTEQTVNMWMKNTYLPLDMIFIARNGTVTHVAADTEPLSERIISSNGPAYAVLEVNAGTSAKIGLKVGDRVQHPMFRP